MTAKPQCLSFLWLVLRGSGLMRSETNGLRAQTTTSPVGCECEVCNTRVFARTRRKKPPTSRRRVCCVLAAYGARLTVLSLCYHGSVGQELVTGDHPSVDEFWESSSW